MSARSLAALLSLLLVSAGLVSPEARGQGCPLIVEGTRWLHHPSPPPVAWQGVDTSDDPDSSSWLLGCAPFGSPGCGFNSRTAWPTNATLYLRQHVFLTGAEFGFTARIAIDNDFELFVNGVSVGSLAKEGCATRWDAVLPIPDGLFRPGDNVVAVRIVDRGGIATFEMVLEASGSALPCPAGCATLTCDTPGPDVMAAPVTACPGDTALLSASASWSLPCSSDFSFSFEDGGERSGWGEADWLAPAGNSERPLLVRARCGESPTCPVGAAFLTFVRPEPGPPTRLGAVLRVARTGTDARLTWASAPPLEAGEVWEVARAPRPARLLPFIMARELLSPAWTDGTRAKLLCYRLHARDFCGRRFR